MKKVLGLCHVTQGPWESNWTQVEGGKETYTSGGLTVDGRDLAVGEHQDDQRVRRAAPAMYQFLVEQARSGNKRAINIINEYDLGVVVG